MPRWNIYDHLSPLAQYQSALSTVLHTLHKLFVHSNYRLLEPTYKYYSVDEIVVSINIDRNWSRSRGLPTQNNVTNVETRHFLQELEKIGAAESLGDKWRHPKMPMIETLLTKEEAFRLKIPWDENNPGSIISTPYRYEIPLECTSVFCTEWDNLNKKQLEQYNVESI